MREIERTLLYSYFCNQEIYFERELHQLQQNIRFRKFSDIDCIELLIARVRLDTFLEFRKNVLSLLKMKRGE